jgi:putative SOS response-associated peptidase YedK
MCGKFTQNLGWGALVELADLIAASSDPTETVTPMRFAAIIRRGEDGRRETARMRWGFVPSRERDPSAGPHHIHARAEGIETKPTFKEAFFQRRGLLIVSSFNEGKNISPTRRVQHVVTPRDGLPLAIAVIWERWGEPRAGALLSFAMVTVPANTLIGRIADRMPAVIARDDWAKWLGEEPAPFDTLKAMLTPFDGDWDMQPEGKRKTPAPPRDDNAPTLF